MNKPDEKELMKRLRELTLPDRKAVESIAGEIKIGTME
jgi:hypothetical protein